LRLAAEVHSIECRRFKIVAELLATSHGLASESVEAAEDTVDASPDNLSSLEELAAWIAGLTESIAAAPLPLPVQGFADAEGNEEADGTKVYEERPEARAALCAAAGAEKVVLVGRLHAVESWTVARLRLMREQLDDVFARMDDWIRDRVRVENNAIKAAVRQLTDLGWSEDADMGVPTSSRSALSGSPLSLRNIRSPKTPKAVASSPNAGVEKRKRRDVVSALYPVTLDIELFQPPELEVALPPANKAVQRMSSMRTSVKDPGQGRWMQDMLVALLQNIMERSGGAAAISADAVLAAILEQRSVGFGFDVDIVPPSWVLRSEAAIAAFCTSFVNSAWGNVAVDITDLMLHLTFCDRNISWPKAEALVASRQMLETMANSLSEDQPAAYPDMLVNEELFLQLPLWDDLQSQLKDEPPDEQADRIRRWIFRILTCCQDEDKPLMLPDLGRSAPASISARRLFTYLGASTTPMAGLQLAMKLMASPVQVDAEAETAEAASAPQILVRDLWAILFSVGGRSSQAAVSPPELARFCSELLPPEADPEPAAVPAGKPGKGASPAPPAPEEAKPPTPPEEMTVEYDEKLFRNKAVLRGLCTHGGLLCRRRGLDMFFPSTGIEEPSSILHDTAQAAAAQGLSSIVPIPAPPEVEEKPEDES
jgi:hypothetical protein